MASSFSAFSKQEFTPEQQQWTPLSNSQKAKILKDKKEKLAQIPQILLKNGLPGETTIFGDDYFDGLEKISEKINKINDETIKGQINFELRFLINNISGIVRYDDPLDRAAAARDIISEYLLVFADLPEGGEYGEETIDDKSIKNYITGELTKMFYHLIKTTEQLTELPPPSMFKRFGNMFRPKPSGGFRRKSRKSRHSRKSRRSRKSRQSRQSRQSRKSMH
jgi:hypothetical protein